MVLLTVNTGSSSVRFALFDLPGAPAGQPPQARARARHDLDGDHGVEALLRGFLDAHGVDPGAGEVDAVAHRVVHGGPRLVDPVVVDAGVERELEALAPLAPLHNPAALRGLRAARAVVGGDVPQVAAFDTAFFAALPEAARAYALPRELAQAHGLRRYGFHGLAHQSMAEAFAARAGPERAGRARVVTLQLGSGCSAAALRGGRPVDTSMGFSPLEGLVMATRPGDVDAGILLHLLREAGLDAERLQEALHRRSGLLGLSGGRSADMRDLLDAAGRGGGQDEADGDADARLAVEVFCLRARKYVGAYMAVLGGLDAVVFGGGIGEHQAEVRARILAPREGLGIRVDEARNGAATGDRDARISSEGSAVEAWVMPPDEEALLARAAAEAWAKRQGPAPGGRKRPGDPGGPGEPGTRGAGQPGGPRTGRR